MPVRAGGDREPLVVLGAGLAGLSFVDAMLDCRPDARILVLDRRREWGRDRTWCTWLTGPLRFAELSSHRWSRWEFVRGNRRIVCEARHSPYIHLDARDVYDRVLERVDRAPNAELASGTRVDEVRRDPGGWLVRGAHGELVAQTVIDATGVGGRLPEPALRQAFLGWEVEAERPVFDPSCATLMDFRGVVDGALVFFYVLPFSPHRALIEHTTIGAADVPAPTRRVALVAEADRRCGAGGWRILHREQGRIPMSGRRLALSRGAGHHVIGSAAGAIRPSSGYAFTRTQRHVEGLMQALLGNSAAPTDISQPRYRALDRLFLAALGETADAGESIFWDLARRVDADRFARFMTDASSLRDDTLVACALPALAGAVAGAGVRAVSERRR